MASRRLIYFIPGSKTARPTVHLHCRVKPRAAKAREGVAALTGAAVHICIAALPEKGAANRAVLAVLSEALGIPRADLQIARGAKAGEKVVAVGGRAVRDGDECVGRLLRRLGEAAAGAGGGGQ